jgi:hypothetical protein
MARSAAALGPRSDVLLAVIIEGIATDRIPLHTVEDVAALYAWLCVIVPTLAEPPEPPELTAAAWRAAYTGHSPRGMS